MKKIEIFLLLLIVLGAFVVRLYRLNSPIADWHSWRQADTAAVARNYIKDGFNFFKPQVDNYVPTNEKGLANNQRLFYVEPPFYETLVFGLYKILGVHEYLARLVSIFFSLGTIIFIYFLVKKFFNMSTALLGSFFFAFMPYSIFYGRVILPEPMMLFASVSSIYFVSEWLDKKSAKFTILAIFFTVLSFLLKAYTLVLLLPIAYLIWQKYHFEFWRQKEVILFIGISLLPIVSWRYFISFYPEGIPSSTWLFNGGNIRFTGAFFHWIFAERLGRLILAYGGIALFFQGLILKPSKKEGWLFHWWLVGILAYFFILARGNITHDYYQVPFIPIAVIFMGRGAELLIRGMDKISRIVSWPTTLALILAMLAFGWFEVRGFYWINHPEIVEAGRAVDRLTPLNSKVIAPYARDVAFLYQTNRHGWSIMEKPITDLISEGATIYASVNFDEETLRLSKEYKVVEKTSRYIILDLTKPSTK